MKLKNILLIIFFALIIVVFITCTTEISQKTLTLGEVIVFNYPVPDIMITDKAEKEAMIKAKIKQLEAINRVYWGELPSKKDKVIEIVEKILIYVRTTFPGFKGLDLDWDKVEKEALKKAKNIKNYGELFSLLSKLIFTLKEGHSSIIMFDIDNIMENKFYNSNGSKIDESYFTFSMGSFASSIGACVVLNDKEEVIVTRVVDENNTYNIKQGDEIVGYNGIPWKEWYPYLLEANIPIYGSAGSSEGAIRYNLIKYVVANANLFEKINIKRYDTGEIGTIPIKRININSFDYSKNCTEYIGDAEDIYTPNIYGLPYKFKDMKNMEEKLNVKVSDIISSGIIKKYNIGYIYITQFTPCYDEYSDVKDWNPYETGFSKYLEKAVLELKNTSGIIIDLRTNGGGRPEVAYKAISHLIKSDKDLSIFKFLKRSDKDLSLYSLEENTDISDFILLSDNPDLYYEKPIIVLVGPYCASACDLTVALFSKFPEFKIIGNHNNGSFSSSNFLFSKEYKIENYYIQLSLAQSTAFFTDDENPYLLRRSDFVDEFVLPTKDDIANGIDTVREHAIKLIQEANKN